MTCSRWLFLLVLFASYQVSSAEVFDFSKAVKITDLGPAVKPTAINNHGVVVGQGPSSQAFRWENGTFQNLGTLGGAQSYANDISDEGIIVGWSHNAAEIQKAFKWDGALTNLDSTTSLSGSAEAITSAGIAGWRTNGAAYRSIFWN